MLTGACHETRSYVRVNYAASRMAAEFADRENIESISR